jgi:hypothetical protein
LKKGVDDLLRIQVLLIKKGKLRRSLHSYCELITPSGHLEKPRSKVFLNELWGFAAPTCRI